MSHKTKDCMERPRNKGAKWTSKHIAADEKVEDIDFGDFDTKRDRWNGYDPESYIKIIDMYANTGYLCAYLTTTLLHWIGQT